MIAIEIKNLSYKYKHNDYYSLRDVTLNLRAGCCTAIIGPNGAGKSTLISILCGLMQDYSGTVKYPLSKQTNLSDVVKSEVALVPQEYAFYVQLSVWQNLCYFASLCAKKTTNEFLMAILAQCNLTSVKNKKVKILSGGYKRRLNIAIALVTEPQVLFLDEPTVGIDPQSRDVIVNLITELKAQGKTILFTSHMLDEVEKLCDEVVILKDGQVTQSQPGEHQLFRVQFESTCYEAIDIDLVANDERTIFHAQISNPQQLNRILSAVQHSTATIKNLTYSAHSIDSLYRSQLGADDANS